MHLWWLQQQQLLLKYVTTVAARAGPVMQTLWWASLEVWEVQMLPGGKIGKCIECGNAPLECICDEQCDDCRKIVATCTCCWMQVFWTPPRPDCPCGCGGIEAECTACRLCHQSHCICPCLVCSKPFSTSCTCVCDKCGKPVLECFYLCNM